MARIGQQMRMLAALLAAVLPAVQAQDFTLPFGECRAGFWSSTRNLDDGDGVAKATCFVNWKQPFSEQLRLNVGARLGMRDSGTAQDASGRLREAFLEADSGPLRLRLGRQVIAWGRADKINPTDNLSPRDYTALVPEDDEQRLGINAVAANYRLGDSLGLVAVLIPQFAPHKTPAGALPRNLQIDAAPAHGERALKLEKSGGTWDGSLSYYDGYERFVHYKAAFSTPQAFVFRGRYDRMRTVGADVATTAGDWSMRAEFSSSRFEDRRSVQRLVLGMDRDFGEGANINAQVFGIRRPGYADPARMATQLRPVGNALDRLNAEFGSQEYGVSLRLYDRYWNDRLKAEIGAIADISSHSGVVRPRATYSFSDAVKATLGADIFYGEQQSYFGSRGRNRLAFFEVAFVF